MQSPTHGQTTPEIRPSATVIPFRKPVRIPPSLPACLARLRAELSHVYDSLPSDLARTEVDRNIHHARWHLDAALEALAKIQGGRGHE